MDFESETFIAFDGQNLADCSAVSATLDSGATNHNRGMHVMAFDPTQITHPENRSNPKAGDPCHTLAKGMHAPAIAFDCTASGMNGFGVGDTANPSRGGSSNTTAHQAALVGAAVRRLTPRECERLQGFPDDWTAVPHRGKPAADGPRYKALGNSWAVPCAAWIGRRIAAVDALQAARAEAA